MLWVYGNYIFLILSVWGLNCVFKCQNPTRRQILTYKNGPHGERVNHITEEDIIFSVIIFSFCVVLYPLNHQVK